ncbi:MAG: hypothetical protein J6S85_04450 [Methanobrevibacter sp.]|nr:hypothetical protein [Methanobrevibacter sp.]MBO7712796.1 hypothetical protein [Methanobrevibacter sp.]
MKELDYRICKIIKIFTDEYDIEPTTNDIARVIRYDYRLTRYHLKNLEDMGIVKSNKKKNKKYSLNVNNLE